MGLPKINANTSFAILGLGKFGMSLAYELCQNNYNVLCCDKNPALVHEISELATSAVQADVTDPDVVNTLGLGNYDIVVVAFSNDFEAQLLITMIAKEKGASFVLAKATGIRQKKILETVGADLVVMPEIEIGQRVAQKLMTNDPMDYFHFSDDYDIIEIPPHRDWIGKSLLVLNLRKNHSLNVLALIREDEMVPDLSANAVIHAGDRIVALRYNKT